MTYKPIIIVSTNNLLPTNHTNLHESHSLRFNSDLFGRTNHTNNMIELVKIRATVQVAIISESNEFVKIREIRGQKYHSWAIKNLVG